MTLLDGARVRPFGETAVVIEYGDGIDPVVHERVLAADAGITAAAVPGVEEVVPSYRSLLVRLDPLTTTPADVLSVLATLAPVAVASDPHRVEIEVSFADDDAPDLATVAERTDRTVADVVALLTGCDLRVYLHGFSPGFAYLGAVPEALHVPRRETPRPPVPAGSVLLAAGQAALCPTPMPTGWWVVGRTDQVLFDPDVLPPVPMQPGDTIRLRAT